ncbi:MAG: YceI family protein [Pseudobdellovibrio sp.]
MRLFLTTILVALTSTSFASAKLASGKYNIDPMHSKVGFEIAHLVISSVEGKFKTFSGTITVDEKFEKKKLDADIEIASIDTSVNDRDAHLKSPDFFDADKYPKMTFKSSAIKGTPESFKLIGDLTIKGKTKKVTFESVYKGTVADAYGNQKAAFVATTKINRRDFDLTWSNLVEAGPIVGDEVTLELKIQAALDKPIKK